LRGNFYFARPPSQIDRAAATVPARQRFRPASPSILRKARRGDARQPRITPSSYDYRNTYLPLDLLHAHVENLAEWAEMDAEMEKPGVTKEDLATAENLLKKVQNEET
jgi:hypothetical protein